ncbi:M20/M25/M40 family metallo-hydrolase [Vibrio sp. PP-XX7]
MRIVFYPGAIDNASGVSLILVIAEILLKENKYKNSILFLFTAGEEVGFLGAKYFIDSQIKNITNIMAGLNFDSYLPIGSTKDIEIIGKDFTNMDNLIEIQVKKW